MLPRTARTDELVEIESMNGDDGMEREYESAPRRRVGSEPCSGSFSVQLQGVKLGTKDNRHSITRKLKTCTLVQCDPENCGIERQHYINPQVYLVLSQSKTFSLQLINSGVK